MNVTHCQWSQLCLLCELAGCICASMQRVRAGQGTVAPFPTPFFFPSRERFYTPKKKREISELRAEMGRNRQGLYAAQEYSSHPSLPYGKHSALGRHWLAGFVAFLID